MFAFITEFSPSKGIKKLGDNSDRKVALTAQ